jgi:uncharacterized protein with von Willebrand factor type A (vWA) domain
MYPFASLPANLAAFCHHLRRHHGFRVGPRQLQDAARALEVVSIADERAVRDALRPVLSRNVDNVRIFDRAFREFFHPDPGVERLDENAPAVRRQERSGRDDSASRTDPDAERASERHGGGPVSVLATADVAGEEAPTLLRSTYSPLDDEGPPPQLMPPDDEWRDAARAFLDRLRARLARRWRPAAHGQRFDLRRTLRSSLHTGGEPVIPRWRTRARRHPHVVILVDGSRSMSAHAETALQLAVGLASVTRALDVFTFSTELKRITRDVRRAAAGDPRGLAPLGRAWGGGTSIGLCLAVFVRRFGERLLKKDAIVMIVSDGLDVGAPDALRDAMAHLRRRAAGIFWLNPLLTSPGYEPTALGMRTAVPYLSTLASIERPSDLGRLTGVRSRFSDPARTSGPVQKIEI